MNDKDLKNSKKKKMKYQLKSLLNSSYNEIVRGNNQDNTEKIFFIAEGPLSSEESPMRRCSYCDDCDYCEDCNYCDTCQFCVRCNSCNSCNRCQYCNTCLTCNSCNGLCNGSCNGGRTCNSNCNLCNRCMGTCNVKQTFCDLGKQTAIEHGGGTFNWPAGNDIIYRTWTAEAWNRLRSKIEAAFNKGSLCSSSSQAGWVVEMPVVQKEDIIKADTFNRAGRTIQKLGGNVETVVAATPSNPGTVIRKYHAVQLQDGFNNGRISDKACDDCNVKCNVNCDNCNSCNSCQTCNQNCNQCQSAQGCYRCQNCNSCEGGNCDY